MLTLAALTLVAAAAEPEELEEEFLEYLAEFDDKEGDWSWFDADSDDKPVKQQKVTKPAASSAEKVKP